LIPIASRFSVSGRDPSGPLYNVTMDDAGMAKRHAVRWLEIGFTEVRIVDHLTRMGVPLTEEGGHSV
jgi:hypothetical protein